MTDNNIQKISHSLLGNLPENLLIKPDLIKYKSFDGLEVSAFLYKPKDTIDNKPTKFGAVTVNSWWAYCSGEATI